MSTTVVDRQTASLQINIEENSLQILKNLKSAVDSLAQDSSFKCLTDLLEEVTRLRKIIDSQNDELTQLASKMKDLEAAKIPRIRRCLM
jgi:hypothetical protein